MTVDQASNLNRYQTNFERDPENRQNALLFFRELNKHEMFMSTVRLYCKYDYDKIRIDDSSRNDAEMLTLLKNQFEYARDHLQKKNAEEGGLINEQGLTPMQVRIYAVGDIMISILVMLAFLFFFSLIVSKVEKKQMGGGGKNFEFKKAKDVTQRLDDVKGIDEIRDEIQDLIKMIKNPDVYTEKGAKLHKGVLLHGNPGTGKTLLSRAIAGEAGTSFLYCTGSNFDEMFVGVGAKRVRELFAEARKQKPCIIFIDEIDTLLSKSRRFGGEHSSSRATINAMLTEMDGFEANEQVLVIGATNHQDALDPAAVRPGRFDKKIHVPAPDVNGRTDIFNIYLDKIEKAEGIEAKKLA